MLRVLARGLRRTNHNLADLIFTDVPPHRRWSCTQQLQRGVHAAWVDGNLGQLQPHLHPGESPGQCQVIEMAEVADPKGASRELAQASTERHVETVQDDLADLVGV